MHAELKRRYHQQMATIREWLKQGKTRLAAHPSAALEAELLLAMALRARRSFLFAHSDDEVADETAHRFAGLLARRAVGEPLAYILGEREFWSLRLSVSPAVLIPRPETELLVEAALARIPADAAVRVADLGTGSGAVALAIASERPICDIHAVDLSQEALAVAHQNAADLRIENVHFHRGSWFEPLTGSFELVVSNPPYVAVGDPHLDEGDLRFEPEVALVAGADGLDAIRRIAGAAPLRLNPGGWLVLEHGHDQAGACRAVLESEGFRDIETLRDLQGTNRVTLGRRVRPPAS